MIIRESYADEFEWNLMKLEKKVIKQIENYKTKMTMLK